MSAASFYRVGEDAESRDALAAPQTSQGSQVPEEQGKDEGQRDSCQEKKFRDEGHRSDLSVDAVEWCVVANNT
ncbi:MULTISPECIES: hypothetical protein [unclassified Streptomyces]|uniref:hypothetical protein n=1 Tax=unclassified Streptomyces TaxID=2593676 RepID=UPI00278C2C24|nr:MULTISPECIES: hypothetical protein [unclassified Streptomyces]